MLVYAHMCIWEYILICISYIIHMFSIYWVRTLAKIFKCLKKYSLYLKYKWIFLNVIGSFYEPITSWLLLRIEHVWLSSARKQKSFLCVFSHLGRNWKNMHNWGITKILCYSDIYLLLYVYIVWIIYLKACNSFGLCSLCSFTMLKAMNIISKCAYIYMLYNFTTNTSKL